MAISLIERTQIGGWGAQPPAEMFGRQTLALTQMDRQHVTMGCMRRLEISHPRNMGACDDSPAMLFKRGHRSGLLDAFRSE